MLTNCSDPSRHGLVFVLSPAAACILTRHLFDKYKPMLFINEALAHQQKNKAREAMAGAPLPTPPDRVSKSPSESLPS